MCMTLNGIYFCTRRYRFVRCAVKNLLHRAFMADSFARFSSKLAVNLFHRACQVASSGLSPRLCFRMFLESVQFVVQKRTHDGGGGPLLTVLAVDDRGVFLVAQLIVSQRSQFLHKRTNLRVLLFIHHINA